MARDLVLISACLVGRPVRYDGTAKTARHPLLRRWAEEGRLVPLCPETAAGLPTPRPAAEIEPGATAADVLAGAARVVDAAGGDHTSAFRHGADLARAIARDSGARFALLAEGSPSCGPKRVADGTFSRRSIAGEGLVARALRDAGVSVFALDDLEALAARLDAEA